MIYKTVGRHLIPEDYIQEFGYEYACFVKIRIRLFCLLTVCAYFLQAVLGAIINPGVFSSIELTMGIILGVGCLIAVAGSERIKTLVFLRLIALGFMTLLLIIIVIVSYNIGRTTVVEGGAFLSSALFVFTLFFVSITIPWTPLEVAFIAGLHIIAYTLDMVLVVRAKDLAFTAGMLESIQYLDGLVFLVMAATLCFIIRKKEALRYINSFLLLKGVEEKNDQMSKELELARDIHKTLVPDPVKTKHIDIAVTYLPAYYVGGDYARYHFLDHDKIVFIISDVTGHGVPAALLVNRLHAEFESSAGEGKEPGELMKSLNEFIKVDFDKAEMYLSAFCGLLDLRKKKLIYSNYGHPVQYLYRENAAEIEGMPAQTSLLGLPMEDEKVYQTEIEIGVGDKILLFTDGVTETVDKSGEQYGPERVQNFLRAGHKLSANNINAGIMEQLQDFKEGEFKDDVCIMTIAIKHHPSFFDIG